MTRAEKRRIRHRTTRIALDRLTERMIAQGADVYAGLMDGTPAYTPQSLERVLRTNVPAFKRRLERLLSIAVEDADVISLQELDEQRIEAKIDVDFDLADTKAADFFRWQAFAVSEIEGELITAKMVEKIRGGIAQAIEDGISKKEFMAQVLEDVGIGKVHNWHLATVFNNNIATAHAASTLYSFEQNKAHFPGWEFMAVMDNETRTSHAELDGKKFKYGDWRFWPPIDHGCRCSGSPIDEIEWDEEGYSFDDPPAGAAPGKGFENHAVKNFTKWVNETAKELPRDVQQSIQSKSPRSIS